MSRNYLGPFPLRDHKDPIRSEAEAWREIIHWRHLRRMPLTEQQKAQAYAAIESDPDASLQMKASIAPR